MNEFILPYCVSYFPANILNPNQTIICLNVFSSKPVQARLMNRLRSLSTVPLSKNHISLFVGSLFQRIVKKKMLLRPHFCVLLNDVITKRVKNKSNTFGSTFFLLDELEHQELFSSLFDGWRNTRWTARLFAFFPRGFFPPAQQFTPAKVYNFRPKL